MANATIEAISPKLQLLSGHTTEQSLAVYRELALSDVADVHLTHFAARKVEMKACVE